MDKKRVRCLYRVSTLKQVEKDDIPMQRISCREFIDKREDWIRDKEYIELGVSGYKLSEHERDVLQEIKKDVLNNEFDVLLVFMFDRIGRREEETPFVVEWLISNGIEVWSVKEGQRKIENRADKLINYLTYWQAGGESEKTSIRVREVQEQMAEKGILTYGGIRNAPYGYDFIKSGTYTKKGVERQKLIKNERETEIIDKIYYLYTTMGYGVSRIARYLNESKVKPRRGKQWNKTTIAKILQNPIYMGYPAYNKTSSNKSSRRKKIGFEDWIISKKRIDELVIISEEVWYKAKRIRESRLKSRNNQDVDYVKPLQTKSKLLLIGLLKCGSCGYSFMTSECCKTKKNGEKKYYYYYKCNSSFSNICNLNKKSMKKEAIEEPIIKTVYNFLDSMEKIDLTKVIEKNINNNDTEKKELKKCEDKIFENNQILDKLKAEVIKNLAGSSNYSSELLNELIETKNKENEELYIEKNKLETIISKKNLNNKDIIEFKNMIPVWKEEFENADFEVKKMLLSEIIKEIRVYNEKIEIDLRIEINSYIQKLKGNINDNCKIIENTVYLSKE